MRTIARSLFLLFTLLSISFIGNAANPFAPRTVFEQFLRPDDEAVTLTIKTDLQNLIRKKKDSAYQTAEFSFTDVNGTPHSVTADVKARGNMRKELCSFPPLKLKFPKDQLQKEGLLPYNKIKVVIQCHDAAVCEEYILKEYLAYKIYNQLTPFSFRVQLLRIQLEDSAGKKKSREMYGFLIEPEDELAGRMGGEIVERRLENPQRIETEPSHRLFLFQYMIGNTDWNLRVSHNMKFLKIPTLSRLIPIPYDFDYSGLVDAHYAIPHESIGIKDVTQRVYGGLSCPEDLSIRLSKEFLQQEDRIMRLCETFLYLDKRSRADLTRYLKAFYKELRDEKRIVNMMANK